MEKGTRESFENMRIQYDARENGRRGPYSPSEDER